MNRPDRPHDGVLSALREGTPDTASRTGSAQGLAVRDLKKHYGGVRALDGVSFDVQAGQCVAMIGPNGAGKSTCFACLAGQQRPDAGEVAWQGQRIESLSPEKRLALGVGRSFQVAQVFEVLTLQQNLQLLLSRTHGLSAWQRLDRLQQAASMELLEQVGLAPQAAVLAQRLPYGERKRLELALALASRPGLLLLDEPAAGLTAPERATLMQLVRGLAQAGIAVLYTEHSMDAVFGVADRVLVLIEGQLIAQGTAQEIARNAAVRERYLGAGFVAAGVDQHA